ncbi:hypothetical protein F4604DRAFT_1776588 [Suillus subluteus]|nr:hypothetical protein F4604DRAFT_1776588 [Suillus subluteus]
MKGFLSLVLVSIALLQMTAAAPAESERSQAVTKREGEQSMSQLDCSICTCLARMSTTQILRSATFMVANRCIDKPGTDDDEVFYLFTLTHFAKHAVLDNPEGMS